MNKGLPYKIEEMNTIKENGAIIDMNDIHFPSIDEKDNPRVSLIYLRNTDFNNVKLDFNNCDYEFKAECLKYFMTGDIIYNIIEYQSTWQRILTNYCCVDVDILSILSPEEIQRFIKENEELVSQVYSFIFSLSYIAMLRLDTEENAIDFSDVKHCNKALFNKNAYSLIVQEFMEFMYAYCYISSSLWFDEHFVIDNEELFKLVVTETPLPTLMYGITKPDEWAQFIDNMVKECEEIKDNKNE